MTKKYNHSLLFFLSLDIVLKALFRLHIIITRQIYNAGETRD